MRVAAKDLRGARIGAIVLAGLTMAAVPAAADDTAAHAIAEKFSRTAEDAERAEAAKKAEAERQRAAAEVARKAEEEHARAAAEAARKAEEERARTAAEAESRRTAAEQRAADEADMLARARAEAEARRREEKRRTEARRKAEEEQARLEAEREAARAEAQRLAREAEAKRQEEARRAEEARAAEAARLAREVEEQRRAEERRQAEAARLAREAEEKQRAEERRNAEEAARVAARKAEEERRKAAERAALEARRLEEVKRIAEKFRLAREARERKRALELEMETRHSLGGPMPPAEPEDELAGSPTGGKTAARRLPTRVTVLLVMERRRRGLRREPNPVLCIGGACYVSGGADDAADYMRRWKALGPGNTLGRRAGPCRNQLTCIYRGVELGAEAAPIQPVDMGFWGHDRREVQTARPDTTCKVAGNELSCANPVIAHGYRAWIVPEAVAVEAGPGALEEALEAGLPAGRSGLPDAWEARVQDLPTR